MPDEFHNAEGGQTFGATLRECEDELHATLKDRILVGPKLGHPLPVIAKINLNKDLAYEPVEAL